jgi:hypothetical protein
MELVLLALLIVLGFVVTLLVMRHLFKQLSNKLAFLVTPQEETAIPQAPVPSFPIGSGTYPFPVGKPAATTDAPAANQVTDESNDFELNEQNIGALPADVKLEVEGGDTQSPPGFDELAKK